MNRRTILVCLSLVVIVCLADFGAKMWPQSAKTPNSRVSQALPTSQQVIGYLRGRFGLTEDVLNPTPLHPSVFPDYYETTFSFGQSPHIRSERIFVSKDGHYAIVGQIFALASDGSEMERISTANRPTIGPVHAPVTIVEFSDYQCPVCAKMHEFMVKQVLPKYKDKIRIVFKDFVNSPDDWGLRAAVASGCAFRIKEQSWLDYRSAIFSQADALNQENVRDTLIGLGAKFDINKAELTTCLDSKSAIADVQKDFGEGQAANVAGTPTFFINSRVIAGFVKPEVFFQAIEQEITAAPRSDCNCIEPRKLGLAEYGKWQPSQLALTKHLE